MSDERFKALAKDPRYRIPNRKESRTSADPRFQRGFGEHAHGNRPRVDRYGRKTKSSAPRVEASLTSRLAEPSDDEDEHGKSIETRTLDEDGASDGDEQDDDIRARRLDPARHGGFSESSSEEESSEEEESDLEDDLADETAGQEQTEAIPMGEVTKRIACVNLDWDHIRASDIMAVASSFAPVGRRIERVTVYPSEFGRERMEREEVEGPPRAIFASSKREQGEDSLEGSEGEDDDEKIKARLLRQQANEGNEFDTGKLRQYQLERLRYYYAVIECDSMSTAKALYDAMDGREYLTSANFFDLRFIPDAISFDDSPRDECTKLTGDYKPNDFTTEALTHSKVRLTWDDDDTTRKEVQKRAFSRAEMDENDLRAYIGSDSSDAESVTSRKSSSGDRKAAKKEAERAKMRAALGLAAESTKSKSSKDEPVGDMQITFTSGLSNGKGQGVFENEPQDEESTRARYIRKEKERRQMRKQKMRAEKKSGLGDDKKEADESVQTDDKADPFDDPFFNDPKAAAVQEKKLRQAERQKKRDARSAQDAEAESRRAELELLMAGGEESGVRHFDMREIAKAEKNAKKLKKSKKGKNMAAAQQEAPVDDFKPDTNDSRFTALFDNHAYAIDPTNPLFKDTQDNRTVLEEARRKRKRQIDEGDGEADRQKSSSKAKSAGDDELKGLVARLKGKNARQKA